MTPAPEKAAPIPALLPCPFCGSEAMECHVAEPTVQCTTCPAGVVGETEAEAVSTWNRRADRASQEERITRADLAALLDEVRRPSASPENHLRQIGVMIERMMEVAGGQEERIREDERDRLYAKWCGDDADGMWDDEDAMLPAHRARLRGGAS